MIRKSEIGLVIALLLFFGVALILPPASAENSTESSFENNLSEDFEVSNVDFDYYTYFFGLDSYGNTVITRYGKLPSLDTNEQKENWNSTLEKLGSEIKDTVASKYMYPHGEVVTCGTNAKGYFVILFRYGNVDEPLMNEIYALIDSSAKKMGIQDVPVELGYGTYRAEITLNSEYGTYYWFGESMENLSESDVHTIQEVMKGKPTKPIQKIVATYGKIPLLKDQKEITTWAKKLSTIANSAQKKIIPYMEREQVIVYGAELTRLEVGINETLPTEEKSIIIKEIYQIIDEEARIQNVTDVPVYFDEGAFIDEVDSNDLGTCEETSNLSASEERNSTKLNNSNDKESDIPNESDSIINNSSENESNSNNSTPGFELFGSLTCLYLGWKLRRKG